MSNTMVIIPSDHITALAIMRIHGPRCSNNGNGCFSEQCSAFWRIPVPFECWELLGWCSIMLQMHVQTSDRRLAMLQHTITTLTSSCDAYNSEIFCFVFSIKNPNWMSIALPKCPTPAAYNLKESMYGRCWWLSVLSWMADRHCCKFGLCVCETMQTIWMNRTMYRPPKKRLEHRPKNNLPCPTVN
jgi:hypothetical protein